MAGAGAMAVAVVVADVGADATALVGANLVAAAVLHLAITAVDLGGRDARAEGAAVAARTIVRGRYRRRSGGARSPRPWQRPWLAVPAWNGDLGCAVLAADCSSSRPCSTYETVYVRAGQDVPLS